ncbi:MAG: hypothetical protein ABMA15_00100 [Vicinamibacterales bacterium]
MMMQRFVAKTLVVTLALSSLPAAAFAQQGTARPPAGQYGQSTTLAGTAKDEAKKPYSEYTVRARDVKAGTIGGSTPLDAQGAFSLIGLTTQNYLVELLNKDGKVVCTEGPFDMSKQAIKSDVVVDCGGIPAAWWLVGAAAAAGITAGIVAAGGSTPASAAQ